MDMGSPRITGHAWGRIEVEGRGVFGDVRLYPGGCREWDWTMTGMHHEPGIQRADVEEFVQRGVEVVVLSRGVHERLRVPDDTIEWLRAQGITVHVMQTDRAVERYNTLAATTRVGALIHSTC
jgi:hypothetical protein